MKIKCLGNGYCQLTADGGVIDTRYGRIYSVVECSEKNVKYFAEAQK